MNIQEGNLKKKKTLSLIISEREHTDNHILETRKGKEVLLKKKKKRQFPPKRKKLSEINTMTRHANSNED